VLSNKILYNLFSLLKAARLKASLLSTIIMEKGLQLHNNLSLRKRVFGVL